MSALLEVDEVGKRFQLSGLFSRRHLDAVKDVSFALDADTPEIFTIIGESGSGKTTLARMILGLERPASGAIRFRGTDMSAARKAFMAAAQPVFQNPFEAFNPLKQVDRYLISTARAILPDLDRSGVERAMDDALVRVGLSLAEVRGRFPHELSGGQLQRVAIALALIPNPALLITDEPVSMVDASLRMSIVNLLKSLRDRMGVSVIYITHDLATAYYISDRLIIMQRGMVVEMGPARAVLDAADAGQGKLAPARELAELSGVPVDGERGRLLPQADGRTVRTAALPVSA